MKVTPYLGFGGNGADALAFYENAFGLKADYVMRYSDAPADDGYKPPEGTEHFIMNASFTVGNAASGAVTIMLGDAPPHETFTAGGDSVSILLTMDSKEQLQACFSALSAGGKVSMEPQATFWSPYFCTFTDRFGIIWMLSL